MAKGSWPYVGGTAVSLGADRVGVSRIQSIRRRACTLDYRREYVEASGASAAFFDARDDAEALSKAKGFYRMHDTHEGFKLWQGSRLVYEEPAAVKNS